MLWQHFGSQSPVLSHEPQSEQIKLNGMCFLVYLINYIVFSLYFLLFPCMSFVSSIFSSARKFFYIWFLHQPNLKLTSCNLHHHLSLPQLRLWCTLHQGANALGCCASDLSLLGVVHSCRTPMATLALSQCILPWSYYDIYLSIDLSIHTSIYPSIYLK